VRPDPDPHNQGYADGFSAGKSESDDTALLRQALEWIEAQPEPRMIGAANLIAALRERLK
jgi:hypothetical protein